MIFQRLYHCLLIVSLVGSVIAATQLSEASQSSVTTPRPETISGRIQTIDRATGRVAVETDTGVVVLEAAPEAIAGWKEGDPVVVKIDTPEPHEQDKIAEGLSEKP